MQGRIAIQHDQLKKSSQNGAQRRDRRKNADHCYQQRVSQPSNPACLHGQQHMKEDHDKQQKGHLLQSCNEDPVFRPSAHIHQIDHRPCRIDGIAQQVDSCVDKRDDKCQESIADQAAGKVIFLARPQMHQL